MRRKMSMDKLNVICLVQDYKSFLISENFVFNNKNSDWYNQVKKYYFELPIEILDRAGLRKNSYEFDTILSYNVDEKILNSTEEELEQFDF